MAYEIEQRHGEDNNFGSVFIAEMKKIMGLRVFLTIVGVTGF
jgi:hypothetical protein